MARVTESILTFEAAGYRKDGRYAKRSDALARNLRNKVRDLSRSMVKTLQYYAPEDTGEFSRGIAYRTSETTRGVQTEFYVRGEHAHLLMIIQMGSRAHWIESHGDYPLRFFWENGPNGPGIYRFKRVWHPGTIPNPFVSLAVDTMSPQFEYSLRDVVRTTMWTG